MLVAHLSDPHLRAGAAGAEAATGLHRALGRVMALEPIPDCLVITGDLAEDGRGDQYDVLADVLGRFPVPVHLTTGNHDSRSEMVARFGGTSLLGGGADLRYSVDYESLTVVVLDSPEPDGPGGRLGAEQLAWLDSTLAQRPQVPAVVCLHHPPVPVGIPFLDAMRLRDGVELGEVLVRHRNVVRVLVGHVHRTVTATFAGTTVTVAPSTYRQSTLTMAPGGLMGYVHEPPGFLVHLIDGLGCVTHLLPTMDAAGTTGHF